MGRSAPDITDEDVAKLAYFELTGNWPPEPAPPPAPSVVFVDSTGQAVDADGNPLAIGAAKVTRRVTHPIGATGTTQETTTDWCFRQLDMLPVTPKRFRFRIANMNALTGGAGTGTVTCNGIYVGAPSLPTSGRWVGAFAAAPTQLVSGSNPVGNSAATEYESPWFDNTDGLITARELFAVSFGFTNSGGNWYAENFGGCFFASQSAKAGQAAAPATASAFRTLDVRIEYEFDTLQDAPAKVMLAVGDSITMGRDGGDSMTPGGCFPYEAWPEAAGLSGGFAVINLGVSSQTAVNWENPANWEWKRADLTTTPPDVAIIALGTNDISNGSSAATVEGALGAVIRDLQALGCEVWVATIIPRGFTGTKETARVAVNNWIREMPLGIIRVIDFDKALMLAGDVISTTANLTSGTNPITVTSVGNGIQVGASVSGTGIAAGVTVTAAAGSTVTLSTAPTATGTGVALTFVNPNNLGDPDLLPNPVANPHPLRGGYQIMAELVGLR